MIRYLFLLTLFLTPCFANDPPVLYKGRYRPMSIYAKLWLTELYGSPSLKKKHAKHETLKELAAEDILWNIVFLGQKEWDAIPLFFIDDPTALSVLGTSLKPDFFTFDQIKHLSEIPQIGNKISLYKKAGFLAIPPSYQSANWKPLSFLDGKQNSTIYPHDEFHSLQTSYRKLQKEFLKNPTSALISSLREELKVQLYESYRHLEGKEVGFTSTRLLWYPSYSQLMAEKFLYSFPWLDGTIAFFLCVIICYILKLRRLSVFFLLMGLVMNTILLGLRCWVLGRPPVSNMFETLLYVPWVVANMSFLFWFFTKNRHLLFASSIVTLSLLLLSRFSSLDQGLENVPAVLNSQYWLLVHVLMVVGSYGAFLLSGILAHIYLIQRWYSSPKFDHRLILYSMYLGTGLLIMGTILGGVWAAQSWGRFWDWDPKESWAFISSCIYLVVIHAFYFRLIDVFGLAIGAIVGLQSITFTWYGVNYILGTGLHSYGFGSGGEIYYYIFICMEVVFISSQFLLKKKKPVQL